MFGDSKQFLFGVSGEDSLNALINSFNESVFSSKHFAESLSGAESQLKDFFLTQEKGNATFDSASKYLAKNGIEIESLGIKSKAASIGMGLLKGAISGIATGLISWTLSKLVDVIDEAIVTSKELHEEAMSIAQNMSDFSEVESSLDNSIVKFKEIRKEIESGTLSIEELTSARQDLYDIQNDLIDTYGDEIEGISLVNGNIDSQIKKLEDLKEAKAEAYLFDNKHNIETIKEDLDNFNILGGNELLRQKFINDDNIQFEDKHVYQYVKQNLYEDLENLAKGTGIDSYESAKTIYQDLEKNKDYFYSLGEDAKEEYDNTMSFLDITLNQYSEAYNEMIPLLEKAISYDKLSAFNNDTLDSQGIKISEKIKEYESDIEEYNVALADLDYEKIAELKQKLNSFNTWFEKEGNVIGDNSFNSSWDIISENINEKLEDEYDKIANTVNEFAPRINNLIKSGDKVSVYDILANDFSSYSHETQKVFSELADKANEYGVALEDIIPILQKMGFVSGQTLEQSIESFTNLKENTDELVEELSNLSSIITSSGSITAEQYTNLISSSKDYADVIRYEAGRVTVDTKKVNELTKARASEEKAIIKEQKAIKQLEYHRLHAQLKNLSGSYKDAKKAISDSVAAKLDDLDAISRQITQYDLLISQIDEATSAFKNYEDAKNSQDYGAQYDTSSSAFKDVESGFDTGKVGSKAFEAAVDLLVPKEIIDNGIEEIHDYYINTLGRYFQYDDSGNIIQDGMINFVQDSLNTGKLFTQDSTLEDFTIANGVKVQDFADELGLTKDAVISFFGELEEYGYGVNFDFMDEIIESASDDIVSLEMFEDKLLLSRKKMMDEGTWTTKDGTLTEAAQKNIDEYLRVIALQDQAASNMADNLLNNDKTAKEIEDKTKHLKDLAGQLKDAETIGDTQAVQAISQEIKDTYNELDILKGKLVEPTELNVTIAVDKINKDIAEIDKKIQDIKTNAESYGGMVSPEDQQEIDELLAKKSELETKKENILSMDTDDARKSVSELKDECEELLSYIRTGAAFNIQINGAIAKLETVARKANEVKIQISDALANADKLQSAGNSANTFISGTRGIRGYGSNDTHAPGSENYGFARANGTSISGASTTSTSLVGELGPELRVRGNQWKLIGLNGAEFEDVRKGDIIFDANQTRDLLSSGKINTRGKSFAHGTEGKSYATGGLQWLTYGNGNGNGSTSFAKSINDAIENAGSNIADSFEDYLDEIEILLSRIDTYISRLEASADLYQTYRNKNTVVDTNMEAQYLKISALQKSYDRYMAQARSVGLSSDWQSKVANGRVDIENITDEDLNDKIQKFKQWYDAAEQCKDEILSANQALRDLANEKLDNIVNDFELLTGLQDAYIARQNAVISLNKATGKTVSESDFDGIIQNQREITNYLSGELEKLQSELASLLKKGSVKEYTEDWYNWQTKIEEVKESLASSTEAIQEYVESIREIRWTSFNDGISRIEELEDEISSVLNLFDSSDLFTDDGRLNNAGKATSALYSQQLNSAKKRAAEYSNAIKALESDLKNGNITQDKYNELLKDYSSAQRSAAADTKKAQDSLIDLRVKGIDKATEAYEEYINIQKKDHQAKKEYDDYLKGLSDKNDEIMAVQAKISALQGDDSNKTQIKKLKNELLKLNDEYFEMKQDHEYDLIEQGYDDQLDAFQKNQEAEKDRLENDLMYRQQVIDETVSYTKDQYQDVYDYITMLGDVYNQQLTHSLTEPWESASASVEHYIETVSKTVSSTKIDTSKINTGSTKSKDTPVANESNVDKLVSTLTSEYKTTSSSGSSTGSNNNPKASQTKGIIGWGDTGNDVSTIQAALNKLGFNSGAVDGIFGQNTYSAVTAFQRAKGIPADGLVGDQTRQKFKESGFKTGGIIDAAHSIGEDGIAFVRNKEAIITEDQVSQFRTLAQNAKSLNDIIQQYPNYINTIKGGGNSLSISYGSLIGEYNAASGDDERTVTKLFKKLFDDNMRRFGQYYRKMGYN